MATWTMGTIKCLHAECHAREDVPLVGDPLDYEFRAAFKEKGWTELIGVGWWCPAHPGPT